MHPLAALLPALSHLGAQVAPTGGGGTAVPPNVVAGLNTLIDWAK